jgi:hypothetical protein
MNQEDETKSVSESLTRRRVLKVVLIGGVATAIMMPAKWTKPIIEAVVSPAHAASSGPPPPKPTTTPD